MGNLKEIKALVLAQHQFYGTDMLLQTVMELDSDAMYFQYHVYSSCVVLQ